MNAERQAKPCGHGLVAWKIDGHAYHETKDPHYVDGTEKVPSRATMCDPCDSPPGVIDVTPKRRR